MVPVGKHARRRARGSCHSTGPEPVDCCHGEQPVILVGNHNVGKSVLFGALTSTYVTVANYPGTTVEVTRGTLAGDRRTVIDTPGVHGMVPFSDDERVTTDVLLSNPKATVVQVVDAKNLRRGLLLSLDLAEAGIPFVVVLNMADEAKARGIDVDAASLAKTLGVPVFETIATRGVGVEEVCSGLNAARPAQFSSSYDERLEGLLQEIAALVPADTLKPRSLALLALSGDEEVRRRLGLSAADGERVHALRAQLEAELGTPVQYAVNRSRVAIADGIVKQVVERRERRRSIGAVIGNLAQHRIWGWPLLLATLYLTYKIVGQFGAGTLVNLVENKVFGEWINPAVTKAVEAVIPVDLVRDLLVGEYGLITMGLTYAIAIVLPIVASFFLVFSILEDSGYMPRLAVMLDRAFRAMGLNGKAVLPMILGLGCDTMATMTTRILPSRKERVQVTLMLALAIPCSAQLGVVLGMITGAGAGATLLWASVLVGTLLVVGFLASRVIPGERSDFILELPPMRVPMLRNVIVKTAARVEWYLKEVVPIFVIGTAVLFVLDRIGVLVVLERALSPVITGWLGLPRQVTGAFLVGFLRRDYGAAGLFSLARGGLLSPQQIVVSLVVITLFVPCFANVMMITKEHGKKVAAAVVAFIFPFAFLVGGVMNVVLRWTGAFGG